MIRRRTRKTHLKPTPMQVKTSAATSLLANQWAMEERSRIIIMNRQNLFDSLNPKVTQHINEGFRDNNWFSINVIFCYRTKCSSDGNHSLEGKPFWEYPLAPDILCFFESNGLFHLFIFSFHVSLPLSRRRLQHLLLPQSKPTNPT